ncbi:MAG: amidase [Kordiimonas sp.]
MQDIAAYDGVGLGELIAKKEISALELVEATIERIEKLNPHLNCISVKNYDVARDLAKNYDPSNQKSPLSGVPWFMKNLILGYEGTETSNSLRPMAGLMAPHDSSLIDRARKAGLILAAKTAVPENGFCISSEAPLYGPTRNCWNQDYIGGGSSGGAGVSVGARLLPFAHASDGAGSTRIPASFNGVFGLKASRGATSYAPDYADIWYGGAVEGCISVSVRDNAAYHDIITGNNVGETYEFCKPETSYLSETNKQPGALKIGFCTTNPSGAPLDPECELAVTNTAKLLENLGHNVEEIAFSHSGKSLMDTFDNLAAVCAGAGMHALSNALGRPVEKAEFTRVNWELAEKGKTISGIDHCAHVEQFRMLGRSIALQCSEYDVVLSPTLPKPPLKLGSYDMERPLDEYVPLLMEQIIYTLAYSCSGQPAMSVPLHWTKDGLPVGLQFAAGYGQEGLLYRLAAQLEKAQPWAQKIPDIAK